MADLFPLLQQLGLLLPATGRMNIQQAAHGDEIQICACSMLNHLLQPSHELNQKKEKDHLSHTLSAYKLAFCHLDPPCPVMEGEFFTVSTCYSFS